MSETENVYICESAAVEEGGKGVRFADLAQLGS